MSSEKPTMTLGEVLAVKRQQGIRCSYGVERANMIKGTWPYGTCLKNEGRCVYQISRTKFYRWLAEEFGVGPAQAAAG